MPKATLTDLAIQKLPFTGKQYVVWDLTTPCFGVRVYKQKSFVLMKRGRYTVLGKYPLVSLRQAREEARKRLALQYFPERGKPLGQVRDEYLKSLEGKKRPPTLKLYAIYLARLPEKLLTDLTHQVLYPLLPQGKSASNICLVSWKVFFNWCVQRQYLERNPLDRAKPIHKATAHERVLSDDEMVLILKATRENTRFNNIVQFCIYSAQRRTQVSLLQRTFVNYQEKTITWPPHIMKNGQSFTMPLTEKLRTLIHRGPIGLYAFGPEPFRAWSQAKKELDARLRLPHWTMHDLRRTARTVLSRERVLSETAVRLLSHLPPKLNRVYDRYLHLPAMQDALLKLEAHYTALLERDHIPVSV